MFNKDVLCAILDFLRIPDGMHLLLTCHEFSKHLQDTLLWRKWHLQTWYDYLHSKQDSQHQSTVKSIIKNELQEYDKDYANLVQITIMGLKPVKALRTTGPLDFKNLYQIEAYWNGIWEMFTSKAPIITSGTAEFYPNELGLALYHYEHYVRMYNYSIPQSWATFMQGIVQKFIQLKQVQTELFIVMGNYDRCCVDMILQCRDDDLLAMCAPFIEQQLRQKKNQYRRWPIHTLVSYKCISLFAFEMAWKWTQLYYAHGNKVDIWNVRVPFGTTSNIEFNCMDIWIQREPFNLPALNFLLENGAKIELKHLRAYFKTLVNSNEDLQVFQVLAPHAHRIKLDVKDYISRYYYAGGNVAFVLPVIKLLQTYAQQSNQLEHLFASLFTFSFGAATTKIIDYVAQFADLKNQNWDRIIELLQIHDESIDAQVQWLHETGAIAYLTQEQIAKLNKNQ